MLLIKSQIMIDIYGFNMLSNLILHVSPDFIFFQYPFNYKQNEK